MIVTLRVFKLSLFFRFASPGHHRGDKEDRPSQPLDKAGSSREYILALERHNDPNRYNREGHRYPNILANGILSSVVYLDPVHAKGEIGSEDDEL